LAAAESSAGRYAGERLLYEPFLFHDNSSSLVITAAWPLFTADDAHLMKIVLLQHFGEYRRNCRQGQ
jgi:hypothetical protein